MIRRALALLVPLTILGSTSAMTQETKVDTLKIVIPEHEAYLLVPRGQRPQPPPEDSVEIPPVDTTEVPPPDLIGDVITDRPYSSLAAPGWYDRVTGDFTIQADNGPISPSPTARARFRNGRAGGTGPTTSSYELSGDVTALDVTFALKLSDNWQNHDSGVNKVLYFGLQNQNNENSFVLYGCPGCSDDNAALTWRATIHGTPMTRAIGQNKGGGKKFIRGQWHTVRVFLQLESAPGQPDGVFKAWSNGTLVMDYNDIQYIQEGSSARRFIRVKWAPIWGGTGDVVKQTMYQYMDNIKVMDATQ
ncbi:MAG: hypothetical protein GY906_37210 [bacterium]|nr:hypothetical protein [bacterium]